MTAIFFLSGNYSIYTYYIYTGGTAQQSDIILFYNDKYPIVYDFDELFPSPGYGFGDIYN